MGKHVESIYKKISLTLNAASHNNASSYTDTDGYLEYSLSWVGGGRLHYKGATLQKIIPVLGGPSLIIQRSRGYSQNTQKEPKSDISQGLTVRAQTKGQKVFAAETSARYLNYRNNFFA